MLNPAVLGRIDNNLPLLAEFLKDEYHFTSYKFKAIVADTFMWS